MRRFVLILIGIGIVWPAFATGNHHHDGSDTQTTVNVANKNDRSLRGVLIGLGLAAIGLWVYHEWGDHESSTSVGPSKDAVTPKGKASTSLAPAPACRAAPRSVVMKPEPADTKIVCWP